MSSEGNERANRNGKCISPKPTELFVNGTASASLAHFRNETNPKSQIIHPQFRSSPTEAPRQILSTLVALGVVIYLGFSSSNALDHSSAQHAALAVYFSFLLFCFLQTRDLILTWPHPGLWRVVFGSCGFYSLCLVGMLAADRDDARFVLHSLFPGIGTQEEFDSGLRDRIDAVMGTCKLSSAALYRQLFHCPWFLAHSAGWAFKMLIFRDYYLAFYAATLFEIMEVSLMHVVVSKTKKQLYPWQNCVDCIGQLFYCRGHGPNANNPIFLFYFFFSPSLKSAGGTLCFWIH